jgi:hypothetical protein
MKKLIVVIIMMFCFNAHAYEFAKDWTKTDTAYQVSFLLVALVDYSQTRWMARNEWAWNGKTYYEINPLLSKRPSVSEVDTLIPLGLITHTLIALALPPRLTVFGYEINPRRIWQCSFILIEVGAIGNNYGGGVKIEF